MSKRKAGKKPAQKKKNQDSVFTEAWENMSEDMARIMPKSLQKGLHGGKRKVWVMVAITFVELVVLGVIGKYVYDWLVK